ncbi:hypothetical protein DSECCO2_113000 [anaerobic digester metagenome]
MTLKKKSTKCRQKKEKKYMKNDEGIQVGEDRFLCSDSDNRFYCRKTFLKLDIGSEMFDTAKKIT